ncbi:hypothetical protein A3I46_00310 [Candidatus Kaiserbacteria bacterium RIFCSPLOWO2_02_FULL_54_13]|uniref:Uncharacterized protein n=1 Tax=Candidatus Kaiserbacteria bacterium RIFCSPHIGHO2_02_FULL_54_22 TaxID=1798495 RepID=A0A1F6DKF1_9BACT|nr:MAG: hypothetical protein UY89_C0002G0018 [Parcubacteria group bacterium GW2011_GWA1_54_9]OGG61780.1 MAG: hypothetical protein A3C19_00815 [Candidatus Kaiserbacteria bacterium RIFCSPHIGHO2_02_FULL_54_22]OGG68141.1 MAG: hypothetical protein A3E99_00540 [Candidatus Kaiserbacteria bacterium RIFCSPHIGHO2_12_FULL_54_16]OGG83230.1 MAG: hypothetical protein A3I46_00310 [Candidatus Kaiserbacteria bacterium RIFCSPLOWO2_02_FULL_54_13]OGG90688.1 MAG: hypothetical protein A3G12_00925 [Candidatus Kaiserb
MAIRTDADINLQEDEMSREYNEQESGRLFRSCKRLLNAKERKDGDLALVTLLIIAVEARSAFYDALDASRVRAEVEK